MTHVSFRAVNQANFKAYAKTRTDKIMFGQLKLGLREVFSSTLPEMI